MREPSIVPFLNLFRSSFLRKGSIIIMGGPPTDNMGTAGCCYLCMHFSSYSSYSTFLAPFPLSPSCLLSFPTSPSPAPTPFSYLSSSFPFSAPFSSSSSAPIPSSSSSRSPPVANFGEQVAQLCGSGDEGELIKTTLHSRHPETHSHPDHEDRRS